MSFNKKLENVREHNDYLRRKVQRLEAEIKELRREKVHKTETVDKATQVEEIPVSSLVILHKPDMT